MKDRILEFFRYYKDDIIEIAIGATPYILIFMSVFLLAHCDGGEDNDPMPTETAIVTTPEPTPTPMPTPTPTPEPTLSPEELDRLIAEEEAQWRKDALALVKEHELYTYEELAMAYYDLVYYCNELEDDKELMEDEIYELEHDLEYERNWAE